MTAAWPSQLRYNQGRRSASVSAPRQPPLVSETEGGPSIMRPRPGPRQTKISWTGMEWTQEEYLAFERFFEVDLRKGVLPFRMPVYKPAHSYVMRVCHIDGAQYTVDESIAPYFVVSFTLLIYSW